MHFASTPARAQPDTVTAFASAVVAHRKLAAVAIAQIIEEHLMESSFFELMHFYWRPLLELAAAISSDRICHDV
jgi:hypothetical protein